MPPETQISHPAMSFGRSLASVGYRRSKLPDCSYLSCGIKAGRSYFVSSITTLWLSAIFWMT